MAIRLTIESDAEALKRYRHIDRARGWGTKACSARYPVGSRSCTRVKGHGGPHVCHGFLGKVLAVWDSAAQAQMDATPVKSSAEVRERRGSRARKPIGLRSRSPVGFIEAITQVVKSASLEEIVFMVFFIAFVVFAIGGFMLIYLG